MGNGSDPQVPHLTSSDRYLVMMKNFPPMPTDTDVLAVQKVLSGSERAGRLRLMVWGNTLATALLHDENWTMDW